MAIDYEVEYNNRARVPEHPEIFARWTREGAAYRDEATKGGPRRDRPEVRPLAAPDHRPVQAAAARERPARTVHPRRLLALARALKLQPDGARHERARRHRRGVRLRPCAAGVDRPDHRADPGGLPHSLEASSASASWSAAIPPAGISPPAWWRPTGRSSTRARRPISRRWAMRSPACTTSRRCCILRPTPTSSSTPPRRGASRRCSGTCERGRVLDAVVGGDESSEFLRHSKIIADAWREQGRRDALRGDAGDEPFHHLRSDGGSGQRDDEADGGAGEAMA